MAISYVNGGEIDEFHKHELMDRIHAINVMFNELVAEHAAAPLMKQEIEKAGKVLGDLYQKAGGIRWANPGDEK